MVRNSFRTSKVCNGFRRSRFINTSLGVLLRLSSVQRGLFDADTLSDNLNLNPRFQNRLADGSPRGHAAKALSRTNVPPTTDSS